LAVLGIATATTLDAKEAEGFGLAYTRSDGCAMQAVLNELIESHRQIAIISTPVTPQLDLDARDDHVSRAREHPIGWRFQHLDQTRGEPAADAVALLHRRSVRSLPSFCCGPFAQHVFQRFFFRLIDPFAAFPCLLVVDALSHGPFDEIAKRPRIERVDLPTLTTVFLDEPSVARVFALIGCREGRQRGQLPFDQSDPLNLDVIAAILC